MKGLGEGSAEKRKKKKKNNQEEAEEEGGAYEHASKGAWLEPYLEMKKKKKKKKKKEKQSQQGKDQSARVFQIDYGNLHIEGEGFGQGCLQKMKKEVEAGDLFSLQNNEEALPTEKKRKRDKTRGHRHSKQATEEVEQNSQKERLTLDDDNMRNDVEEHVISDSANGKSSRKAVKLGDLSLGHHTAIVVQNQKQQQKKNRIYQGEQDSIHLDHGKDPVQIHDEDDMLFNFNMQLESVVKALVNSDRKEQNLETSVTANEKSARISSQEDSKRVTIEEISGHGRKKSKKKKTKSDEGEVNQLPLEHLSASMSLGEEDDMVINVTTQPHAVAKNTSEYKRATDEIDKHAKGSFQQSNKLQDKVSVAQKHPKETEMGGKTQIGKTTEGTPDKSRSLITASSKPTYSIAVAGSIVDNAQSLELATMLAGQIARAAAIFRIDEIVVFDDFDGTSASNHQAPMRADNSEEVGGLFMVRILEYLEVPQYLRRALIPMHRSLSSVGKLPPLDAPHHLRKHEWRPFREGVVLDKRPLSGSGSCVDVGLEKEVVVGQSLKPGRRVTVAMGQSKADGDVLQVVDREAARQAGFYWGYSVRYASCLSAVFDECPFEGKYDFCVGTSEHGETLGPAELTIPKCKHLLVAFGSLSGLEESVELDKRLKRRNIKSLFNRYLNTCPNQGSRTIRTEEAVLISLQFLQAAVQQAFSAP